MNAFGHIPCGSSVVAGFRHQKKRKLQIKERPCESSVVAGFRHQEKRKLQIKESSSSSSCIKKFKWNGKVLDSDENGNVENSLASTQKWRQLLFNNASQENSRSENIFRNKVSVLLYGIDKCTRNPNQWSKEDTNFFYNTFRDAFYTWKMRFSGEEKRDLVSDHADMLTGVYYDSLKCMKFSAAQKQNIDSKINELNYAKSAFTSSATLSKNKDHDLSEGGKQADECCEEPAKTHDGFKEAHLNFSEATLETEVSKNITQEQNEARQQADASLDKLKNPQNCLKGTIKSRMILRVDPQAILDVCLQEKEKQLNELKKLLDSAAKKQKQTEEEMKKQLALAAKKQKESEEELKKLALAAKKQKEIEGELKRQLDWATRKQKETEGELAETREQLQSFVSKSREMTQTKQKEINRKLYEIETSLLMKNLNYRPSCLIENESLNKEDKLFENIKAIIKYESNSANSDNNSEQNTNISVLETNISSSLRVSEYEVHLVTLIAAILKITPFPVSSQTIYSYVVKIDNVVDLQFVERLMRKFPSFFKEVAGEPGSMEKYWIYLDLKPVITI